MHRKSVPSQEARALLAGRKQLQIKAMDLEQTLRGLLRGFGLKVGDVSRGKLPARVRGLATGHAMLERIVEPMLVACEAIWREFNTLYREVLAVVKEYQVCRRLMSVPGVGAILGRRLAEQYGLPFFLVDQIQWLPGWVQADEGVVTRKLDEVATTERWIVDGWGPWPSIERRLARAGTIVFVDLPLWMHFWFAVERQISAARGENRSGSLEGCDQLAITRRMFELIWRVDQDLKPRLQAMLERRPVTAICYHVTTLAELEAFGRS